MNKSLVVEIILVLLAIIGLIFTAILFARDQTLTTDVFLTGCYSLMLSTGSYVMRKNREEKQRKELLAKHPHMSWLYERS